MQITKLISKPISFNYRLLICLHLLTLCISGIFIYSGSLKGEFILDDDYFILSNPYISDWSHLPEIFTQSLCRHHQLESCYHRPLQILTHMVDYSLWGFHATGYHFGNILFHILVSLTLYWLLTILFRNQTLSFLASLLFIIHPVHTEVISYIAGRSEPMAGLFILLSLVFYIKYDTSPR